MGDIRNLEHASQAALAPFTFQQGDRIEWTRGDCEDVLSTAGGSIETEFWCQGGRGNVYRYSDDELLQAVRDGDGVVYRTGERVYPPEARRAITAQDIAEHQCAIDREGRARDQVLIGGGAE